MEELDELIELESFAYDASQVGVELVLWASLVLRGEGVLWSSEAITEIRNDKASKLISEFARNAASSIRDQIANNEGWILDRLPDVCGGCFVSYGLTVSGRYRMSCPSCKGGKMRDAWERLGEMHRICAIGRLNRAILCQLIYKYYSPNGDNTWEMKSYSPLS